MARENLISLLTALIVFAGFAALPAVAQTGSRAGQAPPSFAGEKRVALVIGNANYRSSRLRNPVNDARAVARTLKDVGFDVILKVDANRREMHRAMVDFGRKLNDGGVGLFYYAGHGVQVQGNNYLIPVGVEIEAEEHVAIEAIEVNQVLGRMEAARNRLNIVILDACRNNPFARSFRSATRGLAQTLAPTGSYIAYATAPGAVAEDGEGQNSLYTRALTHWIKRPGLKLEDVFKRVRNAVHGDTKGRQVPWTSSSITGDFYFTPEPSKRLAAAAPPDRRAAVEPDRNLPAFELAFWDSIKDSANPDDFKAYLQQFPKGVFVQLAANRIAALNPSGADGKARAPAPAKAATPAPAKATTLAAVDPKPSVASTFSGLDGTWVGRNHSIEVRFSVQNGTLSGTYECASYSYSLVGTVDPTGKVKARAVGIRTFVGITGNLPKLESASSGLCGNNTISMVREKDAVSHAREAKSVPGANIATSREALLNGDWIGSKQGLEVQLSVKEGSLRGSILCGSTEFPLLGRVKPDGKVDAYTTHRWDTVDIAGTLPSLSFSFPRHCRNATLVLKRRH